MSRLLIRSGLFQLLNLIEQLLGEGFQVTGSLHEFFAQLLSLFKQGLNITFPFESHWRRTAARASATALLASAMA